MAATSSLLFGKNKANCPRSNFAYNAARVMFHDKVGDMDNERHNAWFIDLPPNLSFTPLTKKVQNHKLYKYIMESSESAKDKRAKTDADLRKSPDLCWMGLVLLFGLEVCRSTPAFGEVEKVVDWDISEYILGNVPYSRFLDGKEPKPPGAQTNVADSATKDTGGVTGNTATIESVNEVKATLSDIQLNVTCMDASLVMVQSLVKQNATEIAEINNRLNTVTQTQDNLKEQLDTVIQTKDNHTNLLDSIFQPLVKLDKKCDSILQAQVRSNQWQERVERLLDNSYNDTDEDME